MIAVWIIVAVVVACVLVVLLRSRQHRGGTHSDLGTVSHQWLAEQRPGQQDSQR